MDSETVKKKSIKKRWLWLVIIGVVVLLLQQCHAYLSYLSSPERKALLAEEQRIDKEAYQRTLVDVQFEDYTDENGKKYKRIKYSQGVVKIPEAYLSRWDIEQDYAVQFMAFYMPSKSAFHVPEKERPSDDKKVGFFFLFDVRGGRFLNTNNTEIVYSKLIVDGKIVERKQFHQPGVSVYQRPGKDEGKIYFIHESVVQDPLGHKTAFVCTTKDFCNFSWKLNDGLFLIAEFKDSDIENKIEMIKTLSHLVKTFILE